jgi:ABC-2 type transport system permease protein
MNNRIRTLVRKELLELSRNPGALVPVFLVALAGLALPFVITILVPALTGEPLSSDGDLLRLSQVVEPTEGLGPDARVQFFLFQQFLILFLLTPVTGAMALAAYAVVGEKQARTLEPLLATPISTVELLVAKVLGALLPSLAITLFTLLLYLAVLSLTAEPGVAWAMVSLRTAVLLFLVGPASALVALQAAILVSSRVNDARSAQQIGVLIIVPLVALLVVQFTGTIWLSAAGLAMIGAGALGLWAVLTVVSALLFEREAILTKWR